MVTFNFIVQLLDLLRVKWQYFCRTSLGSKENIENFKKYLMKVIHELSKF